MIPLKEVLYIHKQAISKFGGTPGVRDYDLLDASIKRPYTTFGGIDLYPQTVDKVAAIIESIVKNHPFVDGNKRTGYILMRYLLLKKGQDIQANESEKYEFVISIAKGERSFESIRKWIREHLI